MAALLAPGAPGKGEELVPNLNTYVRSKLSRAEVLNFADCARALASAPNSEDGGKDVVAKVLPRMTLFGALPPSILPTLIAIRDLLDVPKAPNRKTLRLVHYLIQLASGDGSGGTVVPFSPLAGQLVPVRATDQFEYEAFEPLWTDAKAETAYHYQRAAGFRALAALARSSITTDANDVSLISTLLGAAAISLDRCEQARRRKLPPFGVDKKTREAYQRQALEVVATQRMALSAARVGLPRQVLLSKIAPRAFSGVRSPDPVCARHALACAALAAKDAPQLYMEQLGGLVAANVELFKTTGSLAGRDATTAAASGPGSVPARPTSKDPFQESCLNLSDAWARVYLARGCGAVVHSSYVRGAVEGAAAPFWEALTILACCDPSNIVAMEAIRALSGRPIPRCTLIKPSGGKKVPALDERREQEESAAGALAWQLLVEHADDDAPGPVPVLQAPQHATQGFTISRTRRVMQESSSLRRLASLGNSVLASATHTVAAATGSSAGGPAAARPSNDGVSATTSPTPPTLGLFAAVGQRLLNALLQMSHAAVCSATRTVATLAEARARALVAVRADRPNAAAQRELLMGDASLQKTMGLLEQRMRAVAEDVEFGAHQRELALEALLWLQLLPVKRPALSPGLIMEWMSAGGGTVSATVRSIFADPWPEDIMASLMHAILRRLISAPSAATYLLGCANAVAMVCPSRVKHEQLHQLWDTCLRCSSQEVKFAAVRSALSLLSAQVPPIAQPPSAAAAEVKALASKEEAGMVALVRSTVWWLGENANFGANEFAWQPRSAPQEMAEALSVADTTPGQDQLAAAAVAANPLMAMVVTHLQRVMVVRRSLGGARRRVPGHRQGRRALGRALPRAVLLAPRRRAPRARPRDGRPPGVDPLGVCTAAGPALKLLDQLYAGELVVEQLMAAHGPKRKGWPKAALGSLQDRNTALLGAICERLCFVPKELFWPLGVRAKELVVGRQDDSDEEEDTKAAAAPGDQEAQEDGEGATSTTRGKRSYLRDNDDSDAEQLEPANSYMEAMEGYDYKPGEDLPTEDYDASISQRGDESEASLEEDAYAENRASDDDSDIVVQHGIVLYDFFPEESDEVAVAKGEQVDVEYEVGGWLHVVTRAGTRGLVPKAYVAIRDEDATSEGGLSLAGRSAYAESQADAASDYNTFLQRSGTSARHRHMPSQDSDTSSFKRRSSAGGGPASSYYAPSPLPSPQARYGHQQPWHEEQEEDGAVDEAAVAAQLARVEEATADLDRVIDQVEELDASTRAGGLFNQPQFMALKEMLQRTLATLDSMPQPQGAARTARRAARDKAASAADKLEGVRRMVMGGASPTASTPLGRSSAGPFGSAARQQSAYDAMGGDTGYAASSTAGSVYGGYADRSHSRQASWAGPSGQLQGEGSMPSSLLEQEYSGALQQQATRAQVQYAFTAEAEGELTVAVGDTLFVEGVMDGWYQVMRESDGARGLVPASYVSDVEPSYQS